MASDHLRYKSGFFDFSKTGATSMRGARRSVVANLIRFLLLFGLSFDCFAQGKYAGLVEGTATDASGSPLTCSHVIATNRETSSFFTALTDGKGGFTLSLPAGIYDFRVQRDQSQRLVQSSIQVDGGQKLALSLTLKAGLPDELVHAKSVYIVNQTPEKLEYSRAAFTEWGRFASVERVEDADIIAVFRFDDIPEEYVSLSQWSGCCVPAPGRHYVRMAVYDRRSRYLLYASPVTQNPATQWKWNYSKPAHGLIQNLRKEIEHGEETTSAR